ncbi:MAG TPA: protein kinase [Candidatus Acidoferrum sp.]|nr:protein kinase [Candidatus Acidoferrum sp.]
MILKEIRRAALMLPQLYFDNVGSHLYSFLLYILCTAPMYTLSSGRVRFGAFELDLSTGELRSIKAPDPNNRVLLREQVFQVLRMLLEREGKIVTREEIKSGLWPNDTVVDFDQSINATIKALRRALGDSADNPRYIETLARRGYRLMVTTEYLESAPGIAPGEAAEAPLQSSSLTGKKVSHYRVLDVIGGGGMGMVFKAEDLKLGRLVALKFLPEEFAGDAFALKRFEREAQTASALSHPNICTIYEIEEHEGQPFIAMELLQGENLRDHLSASKQKRLPLPELLGISAQICDGLQAAHDKGIIHRDVKPANIFLCKSGTVKILDFGLAKLAGSDVVLDSAEAVRATERATPSTESLTKALTRTGTTAGTAQYMSPEQVRHEELDTRSDLFSFGLVVYEMACGQRAFTGQTLVEVHEAILHQPPAPARARNPVLPRSLDLVLAKALEKDRNRRYQSATALKDDLKRITREVHPARRWTRRALAAGALLAVGALSVWRYEVYRHRITLAPTDTIVLADVDNRTNDPVFDDALNNALRYEMEQTPYLNVLGLDKAYASMGQLKLAPTTRITPGIARQICSKTNSKMVVSDSIADAGNRYQLEMRAVDCGSGATLAEEQEDINSRNEVVHELGVTAVRLRSKLREPSDSLARFNQPLEKALSASPEALQAGTQGAKLYLAGDAEGALKLNQQAVELDPNFALMYWRMGAAYLFLGNTELSAASYTHAYQLRDRLTERDRLNNEIDYYGRVTGDWEKEYSSVLRFLEVFPRDVLAHANLRAAFVHLGQPDRAADEAAETARLRPSPYYFGSAIQSIRFASRFNEAKSWLAQADTLKLDNSLIRRERLIVAFATGDRDNVEKILKEEERGGYREDFLYEHSLIEIQQGRFRSAERLRLQALGRTSKASNADWWVVFSALEDAEVGNDVQARRYEGKAAGSPLDRNSKIALALALARSGRTAEAGKLVDQISAERPEDTLVQHYFIPTIRAAIKLRQHDPAAAIDLLRGTAKYDLAFTGSFDSVYPAYIRGLAYVGVGDGQSAVAQFRKLIDNPGFSVRHVIGPLARLQLGRAQKMMGDNASARKSYEEFLSIWKDADADVPIYRQAKAEYAQLQKHRSPDAMTTASRSAK